MIDPSLTLKLLEVVLFIATMALVIRPKTAFVGQYVGITFHLLLLPVIAATPAAVIGQIGGEFWVLCDVMASMGRIWAASPGTARSVFEPIRMAGHVFAALWIEAVSIDAGGSLLWIGSALGCTFAAYSFAAGRLPEKTLALPGVLMVVWLSLLAFPLPQ